MRKIVAFFRKIRYVKKEEGEEGCGIVESMGVNVSAATFCPSA